MPQAGRKVATLGNGETNSKPLLNMLSRSLTTISRQFNYLIGMPVASAQAGQWVSTW